jgi:Ribonuclease G/E
VIRILAAASPGEVRVAAVDADGLLDYALWRRGAPDGVGDLHRGRITARMPTLAGSFVAIGGGDGFLPDSEGGAGEGTILGVRVTRAAQGGKGPRLTAKLDEAERALVGSGPPALLRRGPNAVARLARLHPDAPVWVDDTAVLAELRPLLGKRVSLVASSFDDDAEAAVEALGETDCALPGGARMSVHPTPALTAIDVDLAAAVAGRGGKAASHAAGNRALLPALARQIRLRNLAGAILVDLAGLSPRRRAALGPDFVAALAPDPLQPRFLGFSALGLAEILRARVHPPLHALLAGPHAAGLAGLRRLAAVIAVRPERAPLLAAAPAVCAVLEQDTHALADLARRAGRPLMLRPEPGLAPLGWRVEE